MNRNKTKLIVCIFVLAMSSLACNVYDIFGDILGEDGCEMIGGTWHYGPTFQDYCGPPEENEQDEGDGQEVSENPPSDDTHTLDECNGSSAVTITVGDSETTKQGHCRYLVQYTSRSASKDVYIYHFDIHTNPSSGVNEEWYREAVLFAGNEYSEYQTVFASGETSVVERAAIVFTPTACNWVGTDEMALDEIAQELANPCR